MKLKYKDTVKVIKGFYEGLVGYVFAEMEIDGVKKYHVQMEYNKDFLEKYKI